jgi:hypothetical protein
MVPSVEWRGHRITCPACDREQNVMYYVAPSGSLKMVGEPHTCINKKCRKKITDKIL